MPSRPPVSDDVGIDELERAIRAVAGEPIFSPAVAARISRFFAGEMTARGVAAEPAAEPFPQLTARERGILDLVAAGMSNTEIAQRLYLSHNNAGLGNPQR